MFIVQLPSMTSLDRDHFCPGNGLLPIWSYSITRTKDYMLSSGPLRTDFQWNFNQNIVIFSLKRNVKLSWKCLQTCLGLVYHPMALASAENVTWHIPGQRKLRINFIHKYNKLGRYNHNLATLIMTLFPVPSFRWSSTCYYHKRTGLSRSILSSVVEI